MGQEGRATGSISAAQEAGSGARRSVWRRRSGAEQSEEGADGSGRQRNAFDFRRNSRLGPAPPQQRRQLSALFDNGFLLGILVRHASLSAQGVEKVMHDGS